MELKVGMYVRTHTGRIEKIKTIEPYNEQKCVNGHTFSVNIIKASYNIIDLIEVGDYVNGSCLKRIISLKDNEMECQLDSNFDHISIITNKDIETIVAKEQFEQIEYRIGDN